mmetsp:Transcript_23223/g.37283  ORF Transcript_23223/g.37283 Transcript_23223/m.37283 type:complete len:340 (-) Transcript_23223:131-1150(-)
MLSTRTLLSGLLLAAVSAPAAAFAPALCGAVFVRPLLRTGSVAASTSHSRPMMLPKCASLRRAAPRSCLPLTTMVLGETVVAVQVLNGGATHLVGAISTTAVGKLVSSILALLALAWTGVLAGMQANPLVIDGFMAGILYALGKLTSSAISGQKQTMRWLLNWAVCGVVDGVCTHHWYHFIQSVADMTTYGTLTKALAMTATSNLLYTPIYCMGFLFLLSLLEGKGVEGAKTRIRVDTKTLVLNSLKVWGPTNVLLFAFVPLQIRTFVSMLIHYVFLVGLAVWDSRVNVNRTSALGPDTSYNASADAGIQQQLRVATAFVPLDSELDCDGGVRRQPADA